MAQAETEAERSGAAGASATRVLKPVAVLLARHEVRNLKRWFDEFDRDILLPILLGEIALYNLGALENGADCQVDADADDAAAACLLRPCNAYSIAAATGLPRETVRRKVMRLTELGWISRRENGHLYVTRDALQHFGAMLTSQHLSEVIETAERAMRLLAE
jgi:hypothetical protein